VIAVSMGLQYGVPPEVYVSKLSHMRFEPSGMTNDEDIRITKSIGDYIVRYGSSRPRSRPGWQRTTPTAGRPLQLPTSSCCSTSQELLAEPGLGRGAARGPDGAAQRA
jgi:hypothetical protein